MSPASFTFDRLQDGALIGRRTDVIDATLLSLWERIYGSVVGTDVPGGMGAVLVMRAYLAIVTPRPPGNIHRALTVRLHAPLARDQALTMEVRCLSKQLRKERRYATFEVIGYDVHGTPALAGQIDMLWAA